MTEHPAYQPPKPFSASFEGYTANPDDLEQWPNTVTVEVADYYDAAFDGEVTGADEIYADNGAVRYLVRVDTNYKPRRQGQHPVHLTRADAIKLAAAVLRTTGDTFNLRRCGQLRPAEAAELLHALQEIDIELGEIRNYALADLLDGTGLGDDQPDESEAVVSDGPAEQGTAAASMAAEPQAPIAEPIPAWPETWPSGDDTFDKQFTDALGEVFPGVAAAIVDSDAIGALAYKIARRCRETDETPAQVLNSVSAEDRAFTPRAADPAAFLASRIES